MLHHVRRVQQAVVVLDADTIYLPPREAPLLEVGEMAPISFVEQDRRGGTQGC